MQDRAIPIDRDLQRRCERALSDAARAAGTSTRQQVRSAARRFVRLHRRDGSYLAFVLRGVRANSALAVALLALAPTPAHAAATLFVERTGAANPLNTQDVGNRCTPAYADLDGDGDLDVVAGEKYGTFRYYQNTGSATAPAYVLRTGAANPLDGQDVGFFATSALGDLDGDGDLDLVSGENFGRFRYFENTGGAITPAFVQRTGSADPLPSDFQGVGLFSTPVLVDLDGDRDLDLVSGAGNGTFAYYENTGTATAPAFAARTGSANPLDGRDVGDNSAPAFGDFDGDGDADLVSGNYTGSFVYYRNTGSRVHTAFAPLVGNANPLAGVDLGSASTPSAGDVDGDGDLDLVAGEYYGSFRSYENRAGRFVPGTGAANPLDGQDVGGGVFDASTPALGDLDGDGDLDVVSGVVDGTFRYYQNTGSATVAAFAVGTNPLAGQDAGSFSAPALGDLDGDGDLDVVAGRGDGTFAYYQNTGSPTAPAFAVGSNPLAGRDIGYKSKPVLADLDGDGDLDLLARSDVSTSSFYFQNTGTQNAPAFTGAYVISSSAGAGAVAVGDVDGDGDLDILTGTYPGVFQYFENTGSKTASAFVERVGAGNPFDGVTAGNAYSTPAFGDLDGDGDPDLVSGNRFGTFAYHENAAARPSPRYFPKILPSLVGVNVGFLAAPAAGDIDGDGDPDLAASKSFSSGAIHYFENTGNALAPKLLELIGATFHDLSAGVTPRLALGDVDADGDLDLVSGSNYGNSLLFFENTGTVTAPAYVERTGGANPFAGVIEGRSAPAFGDVDGDGDLDLVVGEFLGIFHYYRNTGDAQTPAYVKLSGSGNPWNGLSVGPGKFATPALGDVDRDGDLDLVAGDEANGVFHYFENTGSATSPAFTERTGSDNPLDGHDVGLNSSPAFVDLDGDGDLDLVSGERYGTLLPFYLPEPASVPVLGVGAGLLGWLARRRRCVR